MREDLLFSPCGPLSIGPESLEIFRKPTSSQDYQEPSSLTKHPAPTLHSAASPGHGPDQLAPLQKRLCPQQCAVCGAGASGYNYEGVSCGSCKSFFRRAVLGKRKMACSEGGQCKHNVSKETLLKCRYCRFARCIEAGMNPRAITADVRVEADTKEAAMQQTVQPDQPSTSDCSFQLLAPPRSIERSMDRLIEDLMHLEMAYDRLRRSNYKPHHGVTIDECLRGHSKLAVDFGVAPPREKPHGKPRWKFVPMKVRIRDRIPIAPPPRLCEMRKCSHPPPMMWPHLDVVHTIEYFKTFGFFHELSETDKKSLAQQTTLITSFLTNSFCSFELKSDVTVYPDGAIPHSGQILEWSEIDAKHDREVHYETVQRMRRLNLDRREYVLIKALVTCNPAISSLSAASREVLQQQRDRYAKCLVSYSLARRGTTQGPQAYAEILAHVEWLTRLVKRNKASAIHTILKNETKQHLATADE